MDAINTVPLLCLAQNCKSKMNFPSGVYCVAKLAGSALFHARQSLSICLNNEIRDFDLAFGYEAVARALKLGGDKDQSRHYVNLVQQAAQKIAVDEDRNYFLSELNTI